MLALGDLEQLREDLIETVTTHIISGELADVCLQLCRLSTRQEEADLAQ